MADCRLRAVGSGRGRRGRRLLMALRVRGLRAVAAGLSLALVASVVGAGPAWAGRHRPPPVQRTRSVPGGVVLARQKGPDPAARRALRATPAAVQWPAAGTAVVELPAASARARQSVADAQPTAPASRAGMLPVWVGLPATDGGASGPVGAAPRPAGVILSPSRVRVEVLGRSQAARAGLRGVLLRVTRADGGAVAGRAGVSVDYSAFRNAYGADWASRLRLATVPACALSTPRVVGCQPSPLPSRNNLAAGRVSAQVMVPAASAAGGGGGATASGISGGTASGATGSGVGASTAMVSGLLAVTAEPSGAAGDFGATSLSPSATWQAGRSTGDFSWSYPLRTPPSAGGPAPQLSLGYSSGSVDGRTAASNNQPPWVGEGFELWPGYIERRYKACTDDMGGSANNTVKTGDECWGTDNAFMSLGGKASELIKDGASGAWHPKADDGSRVEHLTGGPNGDNDGEFWKVTTVNGTQYWFGRNQLPGWPSDGPETQSTWTVPVFGNNPGEPCHQSSFDGSWCQQAWRWNLDYVVDAHGNSMSYWYAPETNLYGRDGDASKVSSYTRGGTLARVEYGTRTDAEFVGTPSVRVNAPARVVFGAADRCIPGTTCDLAHPANWPDTPWDQNCTGAPCSNSLSPTFWTSKRLATVTTQVWDAGAAAYRGVDSWTLDHSFPEPGDGTRAGLWLAGISHSGLVGGSATMPKLTFTGVQMNNRVDATDFAPPMNWWRVAAINTETGGVISVGYTARECVAGVQMPVSPQANTLRCFPVLWTPQGFTQPTLDWFHKYVVDNVSENDSTGGAPRVITRYEYLGGAAWHFDDDDGLVSLSRKSWAQWRGYARVRVTRGDPGEQTRAETLYFRGMDGDHLPSGTRSVSLPAVDLDLNGSTSDAVDAVAATDEDALAGMTRQQITYNGPDGPVVSAQVNEPWQSAATATRTINATTVTARFTGVAVTHTMTVRDGGRSPRTTSTHTVFDSFGMVSSTSDLGDDATSSDDVCLRYSYARNTSLWLMSYQSRVEKYAQSCDKTPTSADDVIADGRTSFDGAAWGTPPSRGDVTRVEALSGWRSATDVDYLTVSTAGYDANGRLTDKWDVDGNHSTIAYTPASGGPVTQVVSTNPLGHVATATLEPGWGETTATVDANGKRTDLAFDPLGRLVGVWLPGRDRATQSASLAYAYLVRTDGATAVTSQRLNPAGAYVTSYALYDGLLRPRQTQTPAAWLAGGRVVSDTFYNTAGQVVKSFGAYFNSGSPGTNLFAPVDAGLVLDQTATVYDGAGRVTASIFQPGGREAWRTSTGYGGDRVDVTPPAGGTATSTVTDARGRTVALRQYHAAPPDYATAGPGDYDQTSYGFNRKGQLASVDDAAGNTWAYGYDLRGRQTQVDDPDQGRTTSQYDDANQLVSTTDARGQTLAYAYDVLGRRTGVYKDSVAAANQLAGWTYDTLAKGHLTSSTRYVDGSAYTVAVRGYNARYDPTGTVVTIPATIPVAERALAGTYTFQASYKPDGSLAATLLPGVGGLGPETVQYGYNSLGLPTSVKSGLGSYVTIAPASGYNPFGQLLQDALATSASLDAGGNLISTSPTVYQTYAYQADTHRLAQSRTDRDSLAPNKLTQATYSYDPAGNITKIADTPESQSPDTQCFGYDYLRRLTSAWTPTSGDCDPAASVSGLGGPAPYWQSWTYDLTGNRRTQTDHATGGDTTTQYTYPPAGQPQPHTLTSTTTTTTSGGGGTSSGAYTYDQAGNTHTRPNTSGGTQTLDWDPQGHLTQLTDGTATHSFVYDADGNRLLRRDPTGTTLYLPDNELRLDSATGQLSATRYYTLAGTPVAMRTPAGLTWLAADHHATTTLAITPTTQQAIQRRQTPFGGPRGPQPSWPTEKGFVGGTSDPDGLTHLGARDYDPTLGRFISVDPVSDPADPQQLNGYAYAANTPITASDPDGRDYLFDPGNNDVTSSDGTSTIPTDTGGGGGGDGGGGGGGQHTTSHNNKNNGSGSLWDQWNKAKQKVANFAETHKAEIAFVAGFVAGTAVFAGCGAVLGVTGVGLIACGALAGAVGSMVAYQLGTPEKERTVGGLLVAGVVGAVLGAVPGVGRAVAPYVGAAARVVGARIAASVGPRMAAAIGSVGSNVASGGGRLTSAGAGKPLTEHEIGSTLENSLADATLGKASRSVQYLKTGGFDQANADFDALTRGVEVVERANGLRTATLSNGTKVNVRPFSSGKLPTFEIDTPGNALLKIRYY